ncbi:MAG: hypothetical protein M3Y55_03655 [Pseudomonadota bacterium]|nr:hypothetical protein [Pseudomonadota bacterium]
MKTSIASIVLAAAATCAPALSSAAEPAATQVAATTSVGRCTAPSAMSGLQKRIVEKAAQGVDSLRNFIYITRGIYALDMFEAVGWLDAQRSCVAVAANTTTR